jgi:hypothetical protein
LRDGFDFFGFVCAITTSFGITVGAGATLDVLDLTLSTLNLGSGKSIGGAGTVDGSLHFISGALFAFDPSETLSVLDAVTFDAFGMEHILGLSASTAAGIYTLISGTVDFTNVSNVGAGSAFDIGGGKSAYFQEGSLELVVIPEPSTLILVLGFGLACILSLRHRRSATRIHPAR